jgi:chromosome segregation ATPase
MAKALLGHVGGTDLRAIEEVRRLQRRVRELESELTRLRAENDALAAQLSDRIEGRKITIEVAKQPVLA